MSDIIRSISRVPGGTVVELTGEIDLHQAADFHEALVDLCDERPERLIIHLSAVDYIDSSGVGSLVEICRRLKREGGKLILVAPSERVGSVLEITKLNQFFTIVPTEQEALLS